MGQDRVVEFSYQSATEKGKTSTRSKQQVGKYRVIFVMLLRVLMCEKCKPVLLGGDVLFQLVLSPHKRQS